MSGSIVLKIRPTAFVYFDNIDKILKEDTTGYPIEAPRAKPLLVQTGTLKLTIKNESMDFERSIPVEILENMITVIDWDINVNTDPTITINEE